jgi:hypothetical protein
VVPGVFSRRIGKEWAMHKMRRAKRVEQPKFGAQVAFARVATGLQRLDIEELEVGRLHVRELVVEREQKPVVEQEQTLPPRASE